MKLAATLLLILWMALAFLLVWALRASAASTIVEIVLDDVWIGDSLPALESLARQGVRFKAAMTPMPLCTPSRTSLLTGLSPEHHGVWTNRIALADLSDTIATCLQAKDYRTAIVGKLGNRMLELTSQPPGWNIYQVVYSHRQWGTEQTHALANRGADFLRDCKRDDVNCFLYLAPVAPHGPLDGPDECQDISFAAPPDPTAMSLARWQRRQRALCGLNGLIDKIVRVAPEDTSFVIVGDNGYVVQDEWKEGKNELVLDALRIPLVIKTSTSVPSERNEVVTSMDVAATILDLAGATKPSIDGRSLLPLTLGVRNGRWLGSFTASVPN